MSLPSSVVWLGGLLVERRTSVSQIRGSIPGQVAGPHLSVLEVRFHDDALYKSMFTFTFT